MQRSLSRWRQQRRPLIPRGPLLTSEKKEKGERKPSERAQRKMRRQGAARRPLTDDGSRVIIPLAVVTGAVPTWRKEGEGRGGKGKTQR